MCVNNNQDTVVLIFLVHWSIYNMYWWWIEYYNSKCILSNRTLRNTHCSSHIIFYLNFNAHLPLLVSFLFFRGFFLLSDVLCLAKKKTCVYQTEIVPFFTISSDNVSEVMITNIILCLLCFFLYAFTWSKNLRILGVCVNRQY